MLYPFQLQIVQDSIYKWILLENIVFSRYRDPTISSPCSFYGLKFAVYSIPENTDIGAREHLLIDKIFNSGIEVTFFLLCCYYRDVLHRRKVHSSVSSEYKFYWRMSTISCLNRVFKQPICCCWFLLNLYYLSTTNAKETWAIFEEKTQCHLQKF